MTFKIEKASSGEDTVLRISGRIDPESLLELKRHLEGVAGKIVLDLKEVTLADLAAVRFLGACIRDGIELRNCAPYILEWIRRER